MRPTLIFAAVVSFFSATLAAHAGRLDLAVIQYTDARDLDAVALALQGVDLMKITDSDRVESNLPALHAGWVVFNQSLAVAAGSSFANSTRLGNQRANVSGTISGSNVSVEIAISEGVKIGLRKYRESTYAGAGSVAGGVPRIIAVRQSKGKTQTAIKGRATIQEYNYTTLIVARYVP